MVLENWMVVLGCVSIQRNRRENNGVSCSIVHVAEAFSYEVVGNSDIKSVNRQCAYIIR